MFTLLIWATVALILAAMCYAYAASHDVFHPLMFIGPMMILIYGWMPMKLQSLGALDQFFYSDQLIFVQSINFLGIACFIAGVLSLGCTLPAFRPPQLVTSPWRLFMCGAVLGSIGLAAWLVTIINVGGFQSAFGRPYGGGWDNNGYVRDATLLLFPACLLILSSAFEQGFGILNISLMAVFITPWVVQTAMAALRGPAFVIAVLFTMGWYMHRNKRPSLLFTALAGLLLGSVMLFLVTNRSNIYLGSHRELTGEVTAIVDTPDTGNEYIYGSGGILSAEQRNSFYWGRRYLAQLVVRPIPHALWPTKYRDFGLPELMRNAGTGEGFTETLGWPGADGAAPGAIADLWMEFRSLSMPVLFLLGRCYAGAWRKSQVTRGPWIAQYTVMAALSIYFVMQTMEAVIFRLLILSIPLWLSWHFAERRELRPGVPV